MLGRLARTLRLLGYDTLYSPDLAPGQLLDIARRDQRVLLTRGKTERRFPGLEDVYSVQGDNPREQLCEVVRHFALDSQGGLWTRCTLCNARIEAVEKAAIEPLVEPKAYRIYQEFFRCSGCGHIYWRGSHVQRILENLSLILGK